MATERMARVLADLAGRSDPRAALKGLCQACVDELSVSGAGVAVLMGGRHRGTLAASADWVVAVEDLQFTLGEGPCLDVYTSGRPLLEPHLGGNTRWAAYAPEAVAAGLGAVFAVPLQVGAARFGALDLYRRTPGALPDGTLADLLSLAEVATFIVMGIGGTDGGDLAGMVEVISERRAVVHQAAGMISVQLDVSLEEALVALRARAYAAARPVDEVAADVVARRLRFGS